MAELAQSVAVSLPREREGVPVSETVEGRRIGLLFGLTGLLVLGLMGIAGLVMRATQADVISLSPSWFYRLLTLHGLGMLTAAMTAMMGASWYVLAPVLPLSYVRMRAAYAAIVAASHACSSQCSLVGSPLAGPSCILNPPFSSAESGRAGVRPASSWA